ncbi:TlpA family protein disulfide reductase [Chitinophaga cymbidii]|uniref:Thioredoxin-like fold domain-containing protein n=1 Tax=Chitinophaga cymbidii TaxID=1096750 RepID=A0A512RQU7_9BACT|nr:thioredoxin family protein [Chitinophaga cymbidii]GEP98077.1 hypothetical protein CCY01nite_43370 [Chitinophaga cymbidii]
MKIMLNYLKAAAIAACLGPLFPAGNLLAQSSSTCTMKGTVSPEMDMEYLEIQAPVGLYEEYDPTDVPRQKIPVKNGRFIIELKAGQPFVLYIRLPLDRQTAAWRANFYFSWVPWRLAPGMDVEMKLDTNGMHVSGKDAALLECQLALKDIYVQTNKRIMALKNAARLSDNHGDSTENYRRMYNLLQSHHKAMEEGEQAIRGVLASYNGRIDESLRGILLYDWMGFSRNNMSLSTYNMKYDMGTSVHKQAVKDFYLRYMLRKDLSEKQSGYKTPSHAYANYLYRKIFTDLRFMLSASGYPLLPTYDQLMKYARLVYTGSVYDQVALMAYMGRNIKENLDDNVVTGILANMQHPEYRKLMQDISSRKRRFQPGLNYSLADDKGRIRTPADFKGKVVIMDFWFTGCHWCAVQHQNMKPVKEYFSKDTSVVFLSISNDRTKESWLKSVKEGKYSDATDVNVWAEETDGKTDIIRYYNIKAFPTLIIVNGNNELTTVNAPSPFNEARRKEFIALVEKAKE